MYQWIRQLHTLNWLNELTKKALFLVYQSNCDRNHAYQNKFSVIVQTLIGNPIYALANDFSVHLLT
ncbi:hypothetical protein VCO01S_23660 [Vibrio comitans NBRC 102076]|uniref:Uncharacterized protein n=1 Tax=Vibrio comitans NBRC 102076 TaxID=1219078 RepID=A0A4Y3INU1_9VIBR|nr:hypothetical protein VCO01S_23660 [Vibrio comitans NBRC 102076]